MSIKLQQIFYAHDGQMYKVFANSPGLADDVINNAVKIACTQLRNKVCDEPVWAMLEDAKYYYWVQASPGKRDNSNRPTTQYHILLGKKNNVDQVALQRDFMFNAKVQKTLPDDKTCADDIVIDDKDLSKYPIVLAYLQQSNQNRKSIWKIFCGVLSVITVTLIIMLACEKIRTGKDLHKATEIKLEEAKKAKEAEINNKALEKLGPLFEHVKALEKHKNEFNKETDVNKAINKLISWLNEITDTDKTAQESPKTPTIDTSLESSNGD